MSDNHKRGVEEESWHIRYEYSDGRVEQRPERAPSLSPIALLSLSSLFVAAGAGVGAALGLRMARRGKAERLPLSNSGAGLALRALGAGTLLAVAGVSSIVVVVAVVTDAWTLQQFGAKMRSAIPRATQSVSPEYVRPAMQYVRDKTQWLRKKD